MKDLQNHQGSPVTIAGAGPSGLTAGICLARAGYSVQVHEARESVGARFIGDFQVIENASRAEDITEMLKRMGIKTRFYFRPIHQATFYDHRLRPQPVQSRQPYGYFIRRGPDQQTLDQGLLTQALAEGVQIRYRSRVKPEEADIVATGPAAADGLAKQMTFATHLPDTISVLFDLDVAPGGYSYLFVIDGHATFGCAITRDFDHINEYFEASLDRFQKIAPFSIKAERFGYSFMNFYLKQSGMIGGRLYAGEAGGFQDYLFGLGIRYALATGFLAAESLIRHDNYDRLWKKEIGQSQAISLVNRSLYELGGNRGLSTFVSRAGRGDLQDYLGKWHQASVWKKMMLPFLKRAWGEEERCFHKLPDHWCRKKVAASAKTTLGEIKQAEALQERKAK